MDEAQCRWKEEEGGRVGSRDRDGVLGAGNELGRGGRWRRPGTGGPSVDGTLSLFGGGGGSFLPPPINCRGPVDGDARTMRISGRVS